MFSERNDIMLDIFITRPLSARVESRDVPNICFVFASVPNSGPNSVFVFGRIASSKRIQIVRLYSAELETSTADFTQSVPDALNLPKNLLAVGQVLDWSIRGLVNLSTVDYLICSVVQSYPQFTCTAIIYCKFLIKRFGEFTRRRADQSATSLTEFPCPWTFTAQAGKAQLQRKARKSAISNQQ